METIEKERTIGQLVAEDYRKAEIFRQFGLDFCCGGNRALAEACQAKNIDFEQITAALDAVDTSAEVTHDFNSWELDFLIDFIMNTHHKYVLKTLDMLEEYSQKVALVHGEHHPEVIEISALVEQVAIELKSHMQKEEDILFPYIKLLMAHNRAHTSMASPPFGTIQNPIQMMEAEHESAGDAFKEIKALSNHYTPPRDACATFQVLYAKLEEFEKDLHQHVHLENNILFPKAIAMEKMMMGALKII